VATLLNIKEYLVYSKKIFFLNFIIFLSIPSAIIGNFALNLTILTSLIFFVFFLIKKEFSIAINKTYIFYFILFKLFFLFNILFSYNSLLSFNSYLGIIKNIFFVIVFYKVFEHNKKNEPFFFNSLIILFFFFNFDVLIQFFFIYDLFGYPLQDSHGIRLSGAFGKEFVAGSFLSKILFLVVAYIHAGKNNNWILKYFIIFLSNATILLSGERSVFLITAISSLFFIFFDNRIQIKKKILVFFVYLIIIFSTVFLNYSIYSQSKDKLLLNNYSFLFGYEFQVISEKKNNNNLLIKRENYSLVKNFLDTRHGAHFLTGIEIFLDNKILGAGLKSFRNICSISKYDNINSLSAKDRCNTHPHNIYIEFISDLGILGFAIILLLLSYIFIQLLKKKDTSMLAYFLILFFPFQTTGSFFSSFNGFFYYIFFAYFIYREKFCKIEKF
jgi:O-antigen ligase